MSDAGKVSLSMWLASLRRELMVARTHNADDPDRIDFAVDAVEVELSITSTRERGGRGGIAFWVLEAGGDVRSVTDRVQRVRLSLRPVVDGEGLQVRDDLDQLPE